MDYSDHHHGTIKTQKFEMTTDPNPHNTFWVGIWDFILYFVFTERKSSWLWICKFKLEPNKCNKAIMLRFYLKKYPSYIKWVFIFKRLNVRLSRGCRKQQCGFNNAPKAFHAVGYVYRVSFHYLFFARSQGIYPLGLWSLIFNPIRYNN